jgi:hypothetical protein
VSNAQHAQTARDIHFYGGQRRPSYVQKLQRGREAGRKQANALAQHHVPVLVVSAFDAQARELVEGRARLEFLKRPKRPCVGVGPESIVTFFVCTVTFFVGTLHTVYNFISAGNSWSTGFYERPILASDREAIVKIHCTG